MDDKALIANVVSEVLKRMATPGSPIGAAARPATSSNGLHDNVDAAVEQATVAQQQLAKAGMETRDGICKLLKAMAQENANEWGRIELEETKVGRLDHKIAKLGLLQGIPGVEFLKTAAKSGDKGICLDEMAPWGVIGVITPVTHSIPTVTANAIAMIASGNSLVINPHPSGAKCLCMAVEAYNKAIKAQFGIDALINAMHTPTLESADQIFKHPRIPMLVVTGGPAVARAAMQTPKRAVVAGPGNPPVVVDETADLKRAAEGIIFGAAFDNNLLCIGEKEVFVVDSVFDKMMAAMRQAGAVELSAGGVEKLTKAAITWKDDHWVAGKDFIGKDPSVLAAAAGVKLRDGVDLLFGETSEDNPFVPVEQMMPFVPFVRVRDFDQALELALKHEHGFGHTAIIHSNNLNNITRMGQAVNTTLFAVNGPSTGCLGANGEGFPSYSIATPSGEGVTSPLTFTRFRRMTVTDSLRIV
ncbi:MAG: aldehyde dehydrogenase EutE [Phycisphaeraceae bacterium]|nr:aldehyde dehydrogenase EutE [Phycisphaeraceae bacterium]